MMKQKLRSLIIPLLISASANVGAEIVQATGFGDNFNEALHQSKLEALQQVVGTFMVGTREIKDDKVFEDILEYHGGYIRSYDVLEYNETTHSVTISADVEVLKDNTMHVKGDEFELDPDIIQDYEEKQVIIDKFDDPNQAFFTKIMDIKIRPGKHYYKYDLYGVITWQPKWVSDLETFLKHSTKDGKTKGQLDVKVSGVGGGNIFTTVASAVGDAIVNAPQEQSDNSMVCFASKKDKDVEFCKESVSGFSNMPVYSDMKIDILGFDKNDNQVHLINSHVGTNSLYDTVYKGEVKKYFLTKRTFNQPGVIIHKNGLQFFNQTVKIDKSIAEQITKIKIIISKNQ